MRLLSLSWNHRSSAEAAREALALVPAERALAELRRRGCLEAVVLSTCNRFELYAAGGSEAPPAAEALTAALEGLAGAALGREAEIRRDAAAVEHLFAVASGLDSLVIGESEILGQVKTGYEQARTGGMTGKRLNVLFQRALFVGKKVRSETAISSGSASVPSVAVQLAESIFGRLEGRSALILGAGAMAELAGKHLASRGVGRLAVANRSWQRAYQLAARFQGEALRWDDFPPELERADIVIASTGAPQAVITREMAAVAARRRSGRSLFLIDIAMPRDVEETVHEIEGVYLYRLEDLEAIVAANLSQRAQALAAARRIVLDKADEFQAWARSLSTGQQRSLRHMRDVAMRTLALAALLAAPASAASPRPVEAALPRLVARSAASVPYGVLLLAHGGNAGWNAQVEVLRSRSDERVPTETALGMADVAALQDALDRLERRGVSRVIAVPLFVHTRSEVLDQTRYVLGLSDQPSAVLAAALARAGHVHTHSRSPSDSRVKTSLPLVMTPALDAHPLVARILLERARALSRDPRRETVVLVAHGPVDEAAVADWEDALESLAARVARAGRFRGVRFGLLRDDAEPEVRAAAVAGLRATVEAAGRRGRALVVPVLIARGGIEGKIIRDLRGLDYAWDGATLMPHGGFSSWLRERAEASAASQTP